MRRLLLALLLLTACDDRGYDQPEIRPVANIMQPSAWEVGPILDGKSKSLNVQPRPIQVGDGLAIEFPHPTVDAGHVHYVTTNVGSLEGKSRITLRYRVEAEPGVELRAASPNDGHARPAMLTLFFQRCGDDWMAMPGPDGTEAHRWWATFATVHNLAAGSGVLSADLTDPRWTATVSSSRETNPQGFNEAVRDTCRVGFTLGGGDGYGHGVFATGPARFVIEAFEVE